MQILSHHPADGLTGGTPVTRNVYTHQPGLQGGLWPGDFLPSLCPCSRSTPLLYISAAENDLSVSTSGKRYFVFSKLELPLLPHHFAQFFVKQLSIHQLSLYSRIILFSGRLPMLERLTLYTKGKFFFLIKLLVDQKYMWNGVIIIE